MKLKVKPRPLQNDERVICEFLLLPKKANDEWRWLEWACVHQKYENGWPLPDLLCGRWLNIEWVEGK